MNILRAAGPPVDNGDKRATVRITRASPNSRGKRDTASRYAADCELRSGIPRWKRVCIERADSAPVPGTGRMDGRSGRAQRWRHTEAVSAWRHSGTRTLDHLSAEVDDRHRERPDRQAPAGAREIAWPLSRMDSGSPRQGPRCKKRAGGFPVPQRARPVFPPHCPLAVRARPAPAPARNQSVCALGNGGYRDPSRRRDRPPLLHRPRFRGRNWRDHSDWGRRHALPPSNPWGHRVVEAHIGWREAAPPHHRGRCCDWRGCKHSRPGHNRRS